MSLSAVGAEAARNSACPDPPPERPERLSWGKACAALFSLAMIGATLSPIVENWRQEPKDDFPLSYYPMFSQKRSEQYLVNYIVGFDARGNRYVIPHQFAGSGGFNQTRRQLNRVVREKRADELCRAIAARVAREEKPPYTEIVSVQIVTGTYRFADYFGGTKTPLTERVRAAAPVERGKP